MRESSNGRGNINNENCRRSEEELCDAARQEELSSHFAEWDAEWDESLSQLELGNIVTTRHEVRFISSRQISKTQDTTPLVQTCNPDISFPNT